ncbi:MAG TPA: tetrathionate reductase family octaheme c-type cytochrome [Acidiferrobacterales bacterium]
MAKPHATGPGFAEVCTWLAVVSLLVSGAAHSAATSTTADHAKFKELQRSFASGPEVTKACLTCHTEAAKQVHRTKHWTWDYLNPGTQQRLGKKNMVNNFCVAAVPNLPHCASCHIGYGFKDASFDFKSEENVDCLVCHDTTGSYSKPAGLAGHPVYQRMELPPGSGKFVNPVDLTRVAQKVGKTSRDTCGACHFFGGAGDAVKHGDLDSSLTAPDRELDVHMDATGLDFTCGTCHVTSAHDIPGSRFAPTAKDTRGARMRGKAEAGNPTTCVACHGNRPHPQTFDRINNHANKLACQTCHIPQFARGGLATKMSWDWSTAGKLDEKGKPIIKKDEKGHVIYDSKKGDFVLASDVVPEYQWFNGKVRFTLITDKIDPTKVVGINHFDGSPTDGRSLIWPVKVFRGKQPYDAVNMTLVTPHTAGNDDTAYWKNFVWDKAIASGMATVGAPFSGKVGFVATEMRWPITHMVAPKDKAITCIECHSKFGRLQAVSGIYMPGRDGNRVLDYLGWSAALLALIGIIVHGALRIWSNRGGG